MYKLFAVVFIFVSVMLAGCNGANGTITNNKPGDVNTSSVPVINKVSPNVTTKNKTKNFPNDALAVEPISETDTVRQNGNNGKNKTYFISIITNERTGSCFTRRIDIQGTFEKNLTENWSLGNTSEWNTKKTSVTVKLTEDTTMCGGNLRIFNGTALIADTAFKVNDKTKSVYFYANVPVYMKNGNIVRNVSIAIDKTNIAVGNLSGGNIITSNSTEWASNFDSKSVSKFEGVNITIDGGVYVDSLAVYGDIHAKLSKDVSSYKINGTRPVDPFADQASNVGGMG